MTPLDIIKAAIQEATEFVAIETRDGVTSGWAVRNTDTLAQSILSALVKSGDIREWRGIESAPRDGTEFLAFDVRVGKQDVCVMRQLTPDRPWRCEPVQSDSEYGPCTDEFGGAYHAGDIAYWQPLPSPPRPQEAVEVAEQAKAGEAEVGAEEGRLKH